MILLLLALFSIAFGIGFLIISGNEIMSFIDSTIRLFFEGNDWLGFVALAELIFCFAIVLTMLGFGCWFIYMFTQYVKLIREEENLKNYPHPQVIKFDQIIRKIDKELIDLFKKHRQMKKNVSKHN